MVQLPAIDFVYYYLQFDLQRRRSQTCDRQLLDFEGDRSRSAHAWVIALAQLDIDVFTRREEVVATSLVKEVLVVFLRKRS